jgi:glycosyltransferase involved in cell wall biosynthesis
VSVIPAAKVSSLVKILRVIPSLNPIMGGPCQGIRNSIPVMEAIGSHNEVACLDAPDTDFNADDQFTVYKLGPTFGRWGASKHLLPWLCQHLPKYDAVIVHGIWMYHSYAVMRATRMLASQGQPSIPRVFIMPHGMLDPWFQRHPSRRLKAWRNWLWWKLIEQRVIHRADGLLFTCQRELELARETFWPYRPLRELNVGYGVQPPPPISHFMQSAFASVCPLPDAKRFLLFLGRLHPKKGIELLIRAYADVCRRELVPTPPALVIAGPGDSNYVDALKILAQTLGVYAQHPQAEPSLHPKGNVYFPGMLRGAAKWGAFYQCSAFVLPSHQENFGIAVAEALACSKPVLITNQVNIHREIEQYNAGYTAVDNLQGITDLLTRYMKQTQDSVELLGRNARSCFESHFDVNVSARSLLAAVEQKCRAA